MKIVLGVSGGIAAYKAPELVRRLRENGADVRVILTPNAARFVSALSLAAVSDHGVITEQLGDAGHGGVDHIELARWAELLLIAPATANLIAKLATGIADDALSTYALAHRGPLLVAPAMNTSMLLHPTVTANLETLRQRGVHLVEPDSGLLACGDEGAGRMPDPPVLLARIAEVLGPRDLVGKRVLVTAGPTREPLDPVRYLSNRSSGRMGYAIAAAAERRGAAVTLISGPTSLVPPSQVALIKVTTAQEMHDAVMQLAGDHDVVVKAAAVADFAPTVVADRKIKKSADHDELTITLRKTPDILAALGALDPRPLLVAFAAETNDVEAHARQKLQRKNADFIVANDVSDPTIGFDSENNEVVILTREGGTMRIGKMPKPAVANRILDLVAERLRG
jgi:phosphopantothenoylcysteine decarboxylase/phosphopantothenate--cysteine ligase